MWMVVVLLGAYAAWWFLIRDNGPAKPKAPKQQPVKLNKNSDTFNIKLHDAVNAYLNIKNALVVSDTATVTKEAGMFIQFIDSIPYQELHNDSAKIMEGVQMIAVDLKLQAAKIQESKSLAGMRQHFSSLSDLLYPGFLKMVNYEGEVLYIQHCPMAFDGEMEANWLSKETKIMNPYLGNNHPIYKSGMLHCGEVLDSIAP